MIKIRRGLNIPLDGAPQQSVDGSQSARTVALVGPDYIGMKPTMEVAVGDIVKRGQLVFTDKKTEGVRYTAPAGGKVVAINRGARRVFQSLVIEVDGDEAVQFDQYSAADARNLDADTIKNRLIESGQWTALRVRPYSKVADPATAPAGLFITAVDTHPLAADPAVVIAEHGEAFALGQDLLATMAGCPVYVCTGAGVSVPKGQHSKVQVHEFGGPHPAGLVGTHIHFLQGASNAKLAWHVGYQDVIAIGRLF